jgi:hypothetical protein
MFQIHLYRNVIDLKRKKPRKTHLLFNVSNSFVQECHLSKKKKPRTTQLLFNVSNSFVQECHLSKKKKTQKNPLIV